MWRSVELAELRAFLALADELHFGRAAESLHISQSRMSQLIRALEDHLGGRLVERSSRTVTLSPLGDRLLAKVRPLYEALGSCLAAVENAARGIGDRLRIGYVGQFSFGPLPTEATRIFAETYPDCRVELAELTLDAVLAPLRRGEIDLLISRFPIEAADLTVGPVLSRDDRVLVVAAGHPLATRESVMLEDLGDWAVADPVSLREQLPAAVEAVAPSKTPAGRVIAPGPVVNSMGEVFAYAATGVVVHPTIATVFEYYRHPGLVAVPIRDAPPTDSGLVWMADRLSPGRRRSCPSRPRSRRA